MAAGLQLCQMCVCVNVFIEGICVTMLSWTSVDKALSFIFLYKQTNCNQHKRQIVMSHNVYLEWHYLKQPLPKIFIPQMFESEMHRDSYNKAFLLLLLLFIKKQRSVVNMLH